MPRGEEEAPTQWARVDVRRVEHQRARGLQSAVTALLLALSCIPLTGLSSCRRTACAVVRSQADLDAALDDESCGWIEIREWDAPVMEIVLARPLKIDITTVDVDTIDITNASELWIQSCEIRLVTLRKAQHVRITDGTVEQVHVGYREGETSLSLQYVDGLAVLTSDADSALVDAMGIRAEDWPTFPIPVDPAFARARLGIAEPGVSLEQLMAFGLLHDVVNFESVDDEVLGAYITWLAENDAKTEVAVYTDEGREVVYEGGGSS